MSRSLAKDTQEMKQDLGKVVEQLGPLVTSTNGLAGLKSGLIIAGALSQAYDDCRKLGEEVKTDPSLIRKESYLFLTAWETGSYAVNDL